MSRLTTLSPVFHSRRHIFLVPKDCTAIPHPMQQRYYVQHKFWKHKGASVMSLIIGGWDVDQVWSICLHWSCSLGVTSGGRALSQWRLKGRYCMQLNTYWSETLVYIIVQGRQVWAPQINRAQQLMLMLVRRKHDHGTQEQNMIWFPTNAQAVSEKSFLIQPTLDNEKSLRQKNRFSRQLYQSVSYM